MSERKYVRLDECPPGLFRTASGGLGYRNEYASIAKDAQGEFAHVEAYCFDTGEFFWGGAKTSRERAALQVEPISEDLHDRISHLALFGEDYEVPHAQ